MNLLKEYEGRFHDFTCGAPTEESVFYYHARLTEEIIGLYDNHRIKLEEATNIIVTLLEDARSYILAMSLPLWERDADRLGYKFLVPNSKGAKTREWFESTSLAFASGQLTNCFSCAVCNEHIGMSMSHRDTATKTDYAKWTKRILLEPPLRYHQASNEAMLGTLVQQSTLHGVVAVTIDEAFDGFNQIARPGMPSDGTTVLVTGIDYLSPKMVSNLTVQARNRISERARIYGMGGPTMMNGIGNRSIIIYGPTHQNSQYHKPAIYKV